MRAIWIAAIVTLPLAGCHVAASDQGRGPNTRGTQPDTLLLTLRCGERDAHSRCLWWNPSLVELLTRPELYHGKRVRVIGFVNLEFEGTALYLSREDWEQSIFRNSVWLGGAAVVPRDSGRAGSSPHRRFATVDGTFNATNSGHRGMRSGALERVTRIDASAR